MRSQKDGEDAQVRKEVRALKSGISSQKRLSVVFTSAMKQARGQHYGLTRLQEGGQYTY